MSSEWPPGPGPGLLCNKDGAQGGGAGAQGGAHHLPLPPIQRPGGHSGLAATALSAATAAVVGPGPGPGHGPGPPHGHLAHHHQDLSLHLGGQNNADQASLTSITQPKNLRNAVFSKLENLVREMQDCEHGVPVRNQKGIFTPIPAAFMGYDLIEWLMDRLCIEDSPVEAVHLANLLCQFGYYFPVSEQKNLLVKDDSSLYRFQSPYYWPSQHHTPDNIEYAIYLYKRAQRNKKIHGLEPGLPDYEMEALNNLKKILSSKWDFVGMQAEEQLKVAKDRKKGDKIINDSQEKAYWRVYRPPPGYNTLVENSPVPTREQRVKARRNNPDLLKKEIDYLKIYLAQSRVKTSQVAEGLIEYTETFIDWDPLLVGVSPSNPWMSDDPTYWELNKAIPDYPTEKRVRRWAISLEDIIVDPLGVQELLAYMKKEYSHENLRFWLAVQELKRGPGSDTKIKKKVKEIFDEFLSKGAKAEINIDSKTMEETRVAMKTPSRYTYDRAADHVYLLLLKKDCYPRFIRSDHYKNLLASAINPGSSRKRFFNFPQVRKKASNTQAANASGHVGAPGGGGPNPEDFEIYGMDGMGEDDNEKTPLATNFVTPRRSSPTAVPSLQEGSSEACPWDAVPGTGPSQGQGAAPEHGSEKGARSRKNTRAGNSPGNCAEPASVPVGDRLLLGDSMEAADMPMFNPLMERGGCGQGGEQGQGEECWGGQGSTDTGQNLSVYSTDPGQVLIDLGPRLQCHQGHQQGQHQGHQQGQQGVGNSERAVQGLEQEQDSQEFSTDKERGHGAQAQPAQPGENGCWMNSQDVCCPWEDDSLTPTWL